MDSAPLGGRRRATGDFALDRPVGFLFLALFVGAFLFTIGGLHLVWARESRSEPISFLDYVARSWWINARYVADFALEIYLAIGLLRGRRWAMVGLALLSLSWLPRAVHSVNVQGLATISLVFVYAAMRLSGALGPRTQGNVGLPYLPDRIAATIDYVFLAISLVLVARSNVAAYHRVQDMGTIEPLPYLASHWWVHMDYLLELVLEIWAIRAIGRSRLWAFPLMALLSLGWLFRPIHTGDAFYVVSNGLMLLYCVARLVGLRGRRPSSEAGIVAG